MTDDPDKHDIADTDCLEAFDHLYAYLNGELDDEVATARLEHHLGHCKSCFSRAQMERQLNERLKESGKHKSPESLRGRLHDLIKDF